MKVKRYVVDSIPTAVDLIKKDLGKDAIILHTKKIKIGGILGLFGKEKTEVIAAVDPKPSVKERNSSKVMGDLVPKASYPIEKQVQEVAATKSVDEQADKARQVNTDELMDQFRDIKQIMVKLMVNPDGTQYKIPSQFKSIYERLIKQGVDEELANNLITEVIQKKENDSNNEEIVQLIKKEIVQIFSVRGTKKNLEPKTKIIHFVGPTGVGKTTTIAKLAAESVLKEKKKIAFITSDTYRIAAVEQLRTYAEIFNSPLEVVHTPEDTEKAINKLQDFDLIFMDTAGRNYLNDIYIKELNNILARHPNSETFLVLSLTHKYQDMVTIFDQFKQVKIDKLLFTKYDETFTYGSILNILSIFPYKTSYITNGQNVPDDIEVFDEEKMANAILGV